MERNEVSLHEIQVCQALRGQPDHWLTNHEIAALLPTVAERTIRSHTRRLVGLGIVDQAEVFPAHRYRWSSHAEQRNKAYTQRLTQAASAFGLTL